MVPIFSKLLNFGPHVSELLQTPREGLQDPQILWAKVQKQESYEGSNFDDYFDFLEIGELWSTCFDVFEKPSVSAASHQNFVGLSSETKKLLSEQILNFGPDFLNIGELWFTCFGIVRKHWGRAKSLQNFVGQSLKTRKLLGDQFLNFDPDFLETSELWSTSFGIFGKIIERSMTCQNFVGQSSKTTKLCVKNPKIMRGVGHFGGNCTLFHTNDPPIFFSRF